MLFLLLLNTLGSTLSTSPYELPSPLLTDMDDSNLEEVLASSPFLLLDFYTARRDMAIPSDPLTSLSTFAAAEQLSHLTELKFGKIETKQNPKVSEMLGITATSYPTKVLFKEGKVIDIISPVSRNLYYPDILEKWLVKRVQGPVLKLTQPLSELQEGEAVVLVLGEEVTPALEEASLKLSNIVFYQLTQGNIEYQGRVLLQGAAYVVRNFIGVNTVENVEGGEDGGSTAGGENGLLEEIVRLTTPPVQELTPHVFGSVQIGDQWMLGLALSRSKPSHIAILEVFVSAMQHLTAILDSEVAGVYIDLDTADKPDSAKKAEMTHRMIKYFDIDDPPRVPTIFTFKNEKSGPLKAKMETELIEHNIKTFLFEQIQKKFTDEQEEAKREKERRDKKRSEDPANNWRNKKIAPVVRSTLEEWVRTTPADFLVLLCYHGSSPEVSRAQLALSKLEKDYRGVVGFGKINTRENELDIRVPDVGFVKLYLENGKVVGQVLMDVLDVRELGNILTSTAVKKGKEEL